MKKILEDLVFLGVGESTTKILGKDWKLQTLSSQQHLIATDLTSSYTDNLTRIYALKMEILGRALKSIDDVLIENETEGIEFVKKLQPSIVNKLWDEYEKLQDEQNKSLENLDDLKN